MDGVRTDFKCKIVLLWGLHRNLPQRTCHNPRYFKGTADGFESGGNQSLVPRRAPGHSRSSYNFSKPYIISKDPYEVVSSDSPLHGGTFANQRARPVQSQERTQRFLSVLKVVTNIEILGSKIDILDFMIILVMTDCTAAISIRNSSNCFVLSRMAL
jgi:hypothetical protein